MRIRKRKTGRPMRWGAWILAVGFLLAFPLQTPGLELRFRLSGGYSLMPLDSVNTALSDWMAFKKLQADTVSGWSVEQSGDLSLRSAYDFEGELLLRISSRFAVGVASGYVFGEIPENRYPLTWDRNGVVTIEGRPTKISMVPLTVSGYVFQPIGRNILAYARIGAGRIFAKYADRETSKKPDDLRYVYPTSQLAKGGGRCLAAGLGLVTAPGKTVGFFVEILGRKARADGFEGENKERVEGILYIFEEYNPSVDFWQTKIQIRETEPSGDTFRSVRPVEIILDGVSLKLGLTVKF
ncbi:MAG: hypothetical protein SCM96_01725 [Acidobacteriota bacterium]|nr:hypothetical protein [Acidobacteriota bacterium]